MSRGSRDFGFVICPIGEEGSPTRLRSDEVFSQAVTPALRDCGYTAIRADRVERPGIITDQINELIRGAALVIADLTDHNPNVFYELGLCSAANKPVISLMEKGQLLPFDVRNNRTIFVDHSDPESKSRTRAAIVRQIAALEESSLLQGSADTLSKSVLPDYLKEIEARAEGAKDSSGSTADVSHPRIYIAETPETSLGVIFAQSPPSLNRYVFLTPVTVHVTFGRGPDFRTFVGTEDEMMSKYHFVVEVKPVEASDDRRRSFDILVKDIGSKHGTFVNGRKIQLAKLGHGDRIEAGVSQFTLFTF